MSTPEPVPAAPPSVPGPSIDQAQKEVGMVNWAEVTKRLDDMEAALAGMIGHAIAGAKSELPKAKSAADHAMTWFEGVRAKYFPKKPS